MMNHRSPYSTPKAENEPLSNEFRDIERATMLDKEKVLIIDEKPSNKLIAGVPVSLFSGAAYCVASMGMVLLNKMALSSFHFNSANALLFFQCSLCVILVQLCHRLGLIKTLEPFNFRVARVWLPVNIIFVSMIGTSFWALQALNVAMVTVLKNLTNIITAGGDYYFYGRTYNKGVWACMGLMVLSALCGGITDLTFNARGYFWQIMNCVCTAAYSLYLRGAMDRISHYTSTGKRMEELSMVYYNNLLSLPFILVLMIMSGELTTFYLEPDLYNKAFLLVAILSGLLAFGISFTSLWFISTTTPTIYSLVGALNKVPIAFIGLFIFSAPWSMENVASISVGLLAGVVFGIAKSRK